MAFQYTKIKRFIRGRNFPLLKVITKSNNKDKSLIKARQLRQTAAVRNAGGGGAHAKLLISQYLINEASGKKNKITNRIRKDHTFH